MKRSGVNFGVPLGWGHVLFVTSQSKRERVVTLGLRAGVLCDVTVTARASSNFVRTYSKEQCMGSRHDDRTKTGGGYKSTLWDREKEGACSVFEGGGGTAKNVGNIVKGLGK